MDPSRIGQADPNTLYNAFSLELITPQKTYTSSITFPTKDKTYTLNVTSTGLTVN